MIKIFPVNIVPQIDKYTVENEPVLSIDLMERAARQLFEWIEKRFTENRVVLFAGCGNNGGDALALARMLLLEGRDVKVFLVNPSGKFSVDADINKDRLLEIISRTSVNFLSDENVEMPELHRGDLIIDGLLGSGLNRPLKGLYGRVVKHINSSISTVVSIDMPSGLFGEDNSDNSSEGIVKADYTLSFQFPKLSFLLADNGSSAGQWELLDISLHPKAIEEFQTDWYFVNEKSVHSFIKKRDKFSHKGDYGHALLMAGSFGKMGAALLASHGCLNSGAGLLTVHVPHYGYQIMQTAVPEVMVSIDRSDILVSEFPELDMFNAIGVGPGLGIKQKTQKVIRSLLEAVGVRPIVLDADALNIISEDKELLDLLPENSVLTPHPKEFDRLAGESKSHYQRFKKLVSFVKRYNVVVVLKGAHTIIALPDGRCFFNSTGNPGMATAGSGDALTGVILGLLAQKYTVENAAILGVYIHGLAGDIASDKYSQQGVTASRIIENIGKGFLIV